METGFKNLPAFKKRMHDRLADNPEENLLNLMGRAVTLVKGSVVDSIQGGVKSGLPRGDGSFASAPGQPPATDTGVLSSSITIDVGVEKGAVVGRIMAFASDGDGGNYAKHLEFGTFQRGKRHIKPRPFMQPALDKNAKRIRAILSGKSIIK